ncbi:MSMEG_0569 family flavin-dependent oxidoreductase [Acidocella facilis]|uniref:MSMEG_0569 family flavin-dependent oxidoreductase n=1 Tax=Acidocella facilis TaxID=525 RepID=UPI0038CF9D00
MEMTEYKPHEIDVAVIGGGQAGLSASYYLKEQGISHIVFERGQAMEAWRAQRWDNFCLVTPNWQCQLPGHGYGGADPDGFMRKPEIIEYLEAFKKKLDPPLREGVEVTRVAPRAQGGFEIVTSEGRFAARQVVVASGGYREPIIPRFAERLPTSILQIQSADYRNAAQLPEGEVLVVGSGQSGAQIAEDLHLAGKRVHLAVGNAPRCARFYRGRDVVAWLADMGYYEMSVEEHPLREGVRDNTNHYVTGRDGGRDIDLRKFAAEGMQLYGALDGFAQGALRFKPGLTQALDAADATYNSINAAIDKFIAAQNIEAPPASVYEPVWRPEAEPQALNVDGLAAIIWCIGFKPDFGWLDAPVFNGAGRPEHRRGVTAQPGLYFLGLPWLHTWGSGRFSGVARDAAFIVQQIVTARASV